MDRSRNADMIQLCSNLRMLRHIYGYSLTKMAKVCGLRKSSLENMENFRVGDLRRGTFEKISRHFRIGIYDIFEPLDIPAQLAAAKSSIDTSPGK